MSRKQSSIEEEAQEELLGLANEVEALAGRLTALIDRLPVSPFEDVMHLGEQDPDVATEIRRVVECLLEDRFWPAFQDLRRLASYKPGSS